jgi:rubrerythrin
MKQFRTIDDILDFAITAEQEAVDFYTSLAARSKTGEMKDVFTEFAAEEMKHKTLLAGIKEKQTTFIKAEKIVDLKVSDYMTDVVPTSDMTYADALVLAMKKEKNAFRLYMMLYTETRDKAMKELFLSLAMEESKHKLRFELEYDENVLREN